LEGRVDLTVKTEVLMELAGLVLENK
jgi:hypothetical protein